MPSIKEIKNHIKSVQSTKKITSAMYLISSTKMRKAKAFLEGNTAYFQALQAELAGLIRAAHTSGNIFIKGNTGQGADGYLVITADKGLAGPYNQNIVKLTESLCNDNSALFITGEYGKRYFKPEKYTVHNNFPYNGSPSYDSVKSISDYIMRSYENGEIKSFSIIYTVPSSHGQIKAVCEKLLPLSYDEDTGAPDDKTEFFPDARQVLDAAVPQYIRGFIYSAFINSYYCEQSARMAAMDYAGQNADELLSELQLKYHHLRQGAITQEITEISAGLRRKG